MDSTVGSDPTRERLIHRLLERQAEKYGNRTFLYFKDKELSFQDLNQGANHIACGLQKLGIKKGNKVAIFLDNCPEYLFLMFGLSKLGAVEVPINTAHKGDLLTYMLNQSDSCMIAVDSKYVDRVEDILIDTPKVESIIVMDTTGSSMPKLSKPVTDWNKVIDNDGSYRAEEVFWSDPYMIMFTSGTTGPSKGALMPQNYAIYMGEVTLEISGFTEEDRLYNVMLLW